MERLFFRLAEAFTQLPFACCPFVSFVASHFLRQIFAHHAAERRNQFARFLFSGVRAGENCTGLRAFVAQNTGKAAGVDVGNRHGLIAHQIVLQAFSAAEVAVQQRQVADNQTGSVHRAAFHVFTVGAGVADVRVGEGNDLFAVRRIGEDFLITGHGSVKHHFARSGTFIADGCTVEYAAVGKH